MTSYVSADLRRLVQSRAVHLCEYCLIREEDTYLGCQVDHIIAEKHGGLTEPENLCYACACCNRSKGSDLGSISLSTGQFTRFFHPRADRWSDHFRLRGVIIESRTPVGEVTIRILGFNLPARVLEREELQQRGQYPSDQARHRIVTDAKG